jgi:Zn-finger nucleic acid-binding protein
MQHLNGRRQSIGDQGGDLRESTVSISLQASRRPLHCPSCPEPSLHNRGAVGVELDMCGTCGGCYLDREEVNAFLCTGRYSQPPFLSAIGKTRMNASTACIWPS